MKADVYTLCPDCTECPEVRVHEDGTVTIGEAANLVTLRSREWNELVRLIRSGALDEMSG
ncbi:MAG: hypothetical protein L0271_01175 [Gemmatimonadetes bacterium]|nr:hypothetical protein [Gemmatimonadota bacterium]